MPTPKISFGVRRHFNIVEAGCTMLLRVFCIENKYATLKLIKKVYCKLAEHVHPDSCKDDRNAARRRMKVLFRVKELEGQRRDRIFNYEGDCEEGKQFHAAIRISIQSL